MEELKYVKSDNYIVVLGWMRTALHLQGTQLMLYAIIHGFTMDGSSDFSGSTEYLSEWLGVSKKCICENLKALVDKKLIVKSVYYEGSYKYCRYRVANALDAVYGNSFLAEGKLPNKG